ncbi:MAG: glycosyltransferase family 2 protein [Planctomycetota bacterium]
MTPQPQPLSVCIVCKNNAGTIGRTLESVRGLGKEIVAIDSGSTDGTLEILADHGCRVVETEWLGYVRTKQFGLERCAQPWVLSLDSDESLEPELRRSIEALDLVHEEGPTGYRVNRKVWYRGRFFEHAWQPEWRLRLVRRERYRWQGLDPHDELRPVDPGQTREADLAGDLRHASFASFAELMRKHAGHAELTARSLHAAGKRASPLKLALSPASAFVREVIVRRGFLDGRRGWAAAGAMAAYTFMKYVCLLELQDADAETPQATPEPSPEHP